MCLMTLPAIKFGHLCRRSQRTPDGAIENRPWGTLEIRRFEWVLTLPYPSSERTRPSREFPINWGRLGSVFKLTQ